jgi:hypothetical protein
MKTILSKLTASALLFICLPAPVVLAGPIELRKSVIEPREMTPFRDQEVQVDLFGLGNFHKGANGDYVKDLVGFDAGFNRQMSGRPGWGGGLGVNYFFLRYFGVGIEQSLYGRNSQGPTPTADFWDFGYTRWATIGNLFLRYPIDSIRLAPYLMVGGGANYGSVPNLDLGPGVPNYRMAGQGFGHVGGGLEFRLFDNVGIFSDARYLFSSVDGLPYSQLMWRYGIRVAF